jgi:hypothetical protein
MDKNEQLRKIFEDDELGLLNVRPKASSVKSEKQRLIESFDEIQKFVEARHREPGQDNIQEAKLYFRLKGIRQNPEKIEELVKFDRNGLLQNKRLTNKSDVASNLSGEKNKGKTNRTINDVFKSDDLGILEKGGEEILNIKHVPKETNMPDYLAQRKKCDNFYEFEYLFIECHKNLQEGTRQLKQFEKEQQIEKGCFYVLKGIMLYVADKGERKATKGKVNARLKCIFENGLESDMLLRSLSAELYKNKQGKRITNYQPKKSKNLHDVDKNDSSTGFIYIIQSKSTNPQISSISNLYKIGFSSTSVEKRIKNASKDQTYLNAPVHIVSYYECYNFKPNLMESMLHKFFGKSCLDIKIMDSEGNEYCPREWFIAPIEVIQKAVELIMTGGIVNYKYDADLQKIVLR